MHAMMDGCSVSWCLACFQQVSKHQPRPECWSKKCCTTSHKKWRITEFAYIPFALQLDQPSVQKKLDKRPASESKFFRPSSDGNQMLLVHQTAFMRKMLARFGNTIVGLDATYKITKWGFSLFILCVVTNHGFAVPVGIFFTELETTEMITEALQE